MKIKSVERLFLLSENSRGFVDAKQKVEVFGDRNYGSNIQRIDSKAKQIAVALCLRSGLGCPGEGVAM